MRKYGDRALISWEKEYFREKGSIFGSKMFAFSYKQAGLAKKLWRSIANANRGKSREISPRKQWRSLFF